MIGIVDDWYQVAAPVPSLERSGTHKVEVLKKLHTGYTALCPRRLAIPHELQYPSGIFLQ